MSKQFEALSKDLAQGVSRRKAFWRFGTGLGALALGLVFRKQSHAEGVGKHCTDLCTANNNLGFATHGECVSFCVHTIAFNGNPT